MSGKDDERRGALLQHALLAHDLFELLLELLLIEQLARGDAVDLGAQFGDAVLVGELHLGLAGDQPLQHVVVEGEIGAGQHRPAGHDDQACDHEPEGDRSEADLPAAMHQRVVVGGLAARLRLLGARRCGRGCCCGAGRLSIALVARSDIHRPSRRRAGRHRCDSRADWIDWT